MIILITLQFLIVQLAGDDGKTYNITSAMDISALFKLQPRQSSIILTTECMFSI